MHSTEKTLQPIYFIIIIFLRTAKSKESCHCCIFVTSNHKMTATTAATTTTMMMTRKTTFSEKWAQFFTRSYLRFRSKYTESKTKKNAHNKRSVKTTSKCMLDNSTLPLLELSCSSSCKLSEAVNELNIFTLPILSVLIPERPNTRDRTYEHILFLFL